MRKTRVLLPLVLPVRGLQRRCSRRGGTLYVPVRSIMYSSKLIAQKSNYVSQES
jgi:hypothetical protein